VKGLNNQTLLAKNPEELSKFREDVSELNRKIGILTSQMTEAKEKISQLNKAVVEATNVPVEIAGTLQKVRVEFSTLSKLVYGDNIKASREFETVPSLTSRFGMLEYQLYENTTGVTKTHRANKSIVEQELLDASEQYTLINDKIDNIIDTLRKIGIPYILNSGSWKDE
jgi:uncharacterized coiled-coil DUF342 family protein